MGTTDVAAQNLHADAARFVAATVAELEPLQLEYNRALWRASVTGAPEDQDESARLDTRIRGLFARREPFETAQRFERAELGDAVLHRQVKLLFNHYRSHQVGLDLIDRMVQLEKSLDSRFNNFRAELDGQRVSDNQLRQILRESDDSALRRRGWEASKQIGTQTSGDLLELVRTRNRAARDVGFDNYYSMMLTLDELDESELFGLLDQLERGSRELFEAAKGDLDLRLARRFGIGVEALRPWHYVDPFFQEAPAAEVNLDPWFRDHSLVELTRRFFAAIGFDIDPVLERSDLFEKPGKSQHAFCLAVDKREDVRVLCNVRPNERWMATMLHEFGHAVYDQHIDHALPFLLRSPAHTLTTEASAMLFGRLSKNAAWLARYAGMPAAEAQRVADAVGRAMRHQLLVQTRWCLVMCHMERALYRDPEQDLDTLWWDLVERFQWVPRPEGKRGADWASKIHFSLAPVYYHNYMLGEVMASQLQATLLDEVLGGGGDAWDRYVARPEIGAYLIERLFRPGKSIDWREAIRRATGRPLTTDAFITELAG